METTLFWELPFLALAGIHYKYNQCHTTLGRSGSVSPKLEPASSKYNKILEIMFCKNLHCMLFVTKNILINIHQHIQRRCVCVLCGSPKPDLPEHTRGLLIYFPGILGHAPENRVGTLKA